MTAEEKRRVIDALTKKMLELGRPVLLLSQIKKILEEADIGAEIYGKQLKVWLQTNFQDDFYVSTADRLYYIGSEIPRARSQEVIGAILTDTLQAEERYLCAKIPDLLSQFNGLKYQDFSNGMRMSDWIRATFPQLDVSENYLVLKQEARVIPLSDEFLQMEKLVRLEELTKACVWMQRLSGRLINETEVKNMLADAFWKAVIGQSVLYTEKANDEIVGFAFVLGAVSANGNPFYVIIKRNNEDDPCKWRLLGFSCPQEVGPLPGAQWILTKVRSAGRSISDIREKIENIKALRETTLQQVKAFEEQLEAGSPPDRTVQTGISDYIDLWDSLMKELAAWRSFDGGVVTLQQAEALFRGEEASKELCDKILKEFRAVTDFVHAFLTQTLGFQPKEGENTTPQKDIALVEKLFDNMLTPEGFDLLSDTVHYYEQLLTVMRAKASNGVWDAMAELWEHFPSPEIPPTPVPLMNKSEEECAPLQRIKTVRSLMEEYRDMEESQDAQDAQDTERQELPADELKERLLRGDASLLCAVPVLMHDLLPSEKVLRDVVLVKDADPAQREAGKAVPDGYSPYCVGARLYSAAGNQDRLAEKYFLLGLFCDTAHCGSGLLRIYREADDFDAFQSVWEYTKGQSYASEEDTVFWISKRAELASDMADCMDDVAQILKRYPRLFDNPKYRGVYASIIDQMTDMPEVYKKWLIRSKVSLNAFENAISENNLDQVYSMLDAPETLVALGYTEDEINAISERLRGDFVTGLDDYSKGRRLFQILGDKNGAAEKYFWESADPRATVELFHIYYGKQDYNSARWIVENRDVDFNLQPAVLEPYSDSLIRLNEKEKLAALAVKHPEIWYCDGVLAAMDAAQPDGPFDWSAIYSWSAENPFTEPNAFENALIAGDTELARTLAENREQMALWGYPEALQEAVLPKLEGRAAADGGVKEAAKRIFAVQGNFRRTYEAELRSALSVDRNWALNALFGLFVSDARHWDIIAYYRAYGQILNAAEPYKAYLRSLIALKKNDLLINTVLNNYKDLQQDEALLNRIFEIAEAEGRGNEIDTLRRKLATLPRNRFEENLIRLNKSVLREYINAPTTLEALGYDWDRIQQIRESFRKPFIEGDDGYLVADRIRKFLGNERAEPFFLASLVSEEDSRSARTLIDIYFQQKRWDDLCALYRKYDDGTLWYENETSKYATALSHSSAEENREIYLGMLESELRGSLPAEDYVWAYLRALIGAQRFEDAYAYIETVFTQDPDLSEKNLSAFFDFAWGLSKEAKEFSLRLIGRLLQFRKAESFTSNELSQIVSAYGKVLSETEDVDALETFLLENGLTEQMFWLNVYYGLFIIGKPEKKETFYRSLINELDSPEKAQIGIKQLMPYFEVYKYLDGGEPVFERYAECLLRRVIDLAESGALFADRNYDTIRYLLNSGIFSQEQSAEILKRLLDFMDTKAEDAEKYELTMFATDMAAAIANRAAAEEGAAQPLPGTAPFAVCGALAEKWNALLEDAAAALPNKDWDCFLQFLRLPYVTPAAAEALAAAWLKKAQPTDAQLLRRMIQLAAEKKISLQAGLLCEALVNVIDRLKNTEISEETDQQIALCIETTPWEPAHVEAIVQSLQQIAVYDCNYTNAATRALLRDRDTVLCYDWIKREVIYFTEDEDRLADLFPVLLNRAKELPPDYAYTNDDCQLLYEAVCGSPSQENFVFLRDVYQRVGKEDQREILDVLARDFSAAGEKTVYTWLLSVLNNRDVDWVERYAKWWQNLIHLTDEDLQTKSTISFLGLSDDPISDTALNSLSRLLMSNVHNDNYLRCYSRVMNRLSELSEEADCKLQYLNADADPDQLVSSVKKCFRNKHFELGFRLLLHKMEKPTSTTSAEGQLLADVITAENLRAYPKMREHLPEVYEWIGKLNAWDPSGEWKNFGRAVDIAVITDSEEMLLAKFREPLLTLYPGRTSVLIASLVKKHQFESAGNWLGQAQQYNMYEYYAILENVLQTCRETNALSATDLLKLETIPEDGNRRSLEFYGDFLLSAYERGLKKECLSVMEYLYDVAQNDKAYFCTLISLYSMKPLSQPNLIWLYQLAKRYFQLTQEENVPRAAGMLAMLHACIQTECAEKQDNVYAYCNNERPRQNAYQRVTDLEQDCKNWIENADRSDIVLRIVVYSAIGHWELDGELIDTMLRSITTAKKTIKYFPEAFCAACVRAALQNREDADSRRRIGELLQGLLQPVCEKNLGLADNLSQETAERLRMLLEIPIVAPGVFANIVKDVLTRQEKAPDNGEFESELRLLFSMNTAFTNAAYSANKYGLRDYVETECSEATRSVFVRMLTHVSLDLQEAKGNIPHPGIYMQNREYHKVIESAEYYMKKTLPDDPIKNIKLLAFNSYIKAGRLLEGSLSPEEIKKFRPEDFLNVVNVICQNGEAYKDLDTVFRYMPARWKILTRCMQELIQGTPRNILYVMEQDDFWEEHTACAGYVVRIAKDFVSANKTKNKKGQALLVAENLKSRLNPDVGTYTEKDIRPAEKTIPTSVSTLIVSARNKQQLTPFREDIDRYLAEMVAEDELENQKKEKAKKKQAPVLPVQETADASQTAGNGVITEDSAPEIDFRKTGFVVNAIAAFREKRKAEQAEDAPEAAAEPGLSRADELVAQIAQDLDNPTDNLRRLCVELGITLFDGYCERNGLKTVVPEQARTVLYETAACISDGMDKRGLSAAIKTDLELCIESYTDLSALAADCMRREPILLCDLIDEPEVRNAFKAHIMQIRQIGIFLSTPKTPAERLEKLEKQIGLCRDKQTAIDSKLKYHLISLINNVIRDFREMANVIVEVYNTQGSAYEGCIFGRIQNTGGEIVKNVCMVLNLNGVFRQTYKLDYLEAKTMVPFTLKYTAPPEMEKLQYSLKAIYETQNNTKEETREVNGTLKLVDTENDEYKFFAFQTSRPAGKADYIDRVKIQAQIGRFYSAGKEFRDFPTLAVYGMRRTGKSSVLKKLERMLTENFCEDVLLVETSGEGATAGSLTHAVHSMLVRQVLKNRGDGYASLVDCMAENDEWRQFAEKWETAPPESTDFQWVQDFYDELIVKFLQNKKLVVLIDEVDKIYGGYEEKPNVDMAADAWNAAPENMPGTAEAGDSATQTNLWGILTRITQREADPVRFILCGSDYFTNSMIEGDAFTQFFQKAEKVRVGRMSRSELELSLQTPVNGSDTDLRFHRDTIPYLWTLCDGLPWHAKLILNDAIAKKLITENRTVIYPSDVMSGADFVLSSGLISTENNFGVVALFAEERLFLKILSKKAVTMNTWVSEDEIYAEFCNPPQELGMEHILANARLDRASFDRAKKLLLTERQLIVSRNDQEGTKYRFGCELYRLYNRGEKYIAQQFYVV